MWILFIDRLLLENNKIRLSWRYLILKQSNLEIMRKTKRIKFDFFDVIKCPTNKYYLSVDKFGHEIIRGKSFEDVVRKTKELQIEFIIGNDKYLGWL